MVKRRAPWLTYTICVYAVCWGVETTSIYGPPGFELSGPPGFELSGHDTDRYLTESDVYPEFELEGKKVQECIWSKKFSFYKKIKITSRTLMITVRIIFT